MKAFIEKLRGKSDATKTRIALGSAAAVTALIIGVWFAAGSERPAEAVASSESAREDLKPLFMIFKNAKEGIGTLKASVGSRAERRDARKEEAAADASVEGPEDFTIIE